MGSRLPCRVAVVPSRRKGGDGDRRRAPAAAVLPGGRLWRGVLDLSVIVTGGTNTAASAAGGKRGGNNGGPPTGGTSKAGRDGSITATGNGPTGNAAACGA